MRKSSAPTFALCGTVLLVLLFVTGRFVYIGHHSTAFEKIAGKGVQELLILSENDSELRRLTEPSEITPFVDLLSDCVFTEYPHLLHPGRQKLSGNLLTVTFANQNSIGVNADGFVFVNGKLRDVQDRRGQELYHKLYLLFYPSAY